MKFALFDVFNSVGLHGIMTNFVHTFSSLVAVWLLNFPVSRAFYVVLAAFSILEECLSFVSVEATMLKFEDDSEVEVEQGQTFDIVINCTNPDGERSHGK